ncbi:coproporphyrinogen III oxidase [Sulfurimonas aquatica]|uniref:coproporphyrinogen oxidase n=1 Tax=Sulfurimonas aquatica TaxID=2672570 RepID=A0A975AZS7_9BACT|nr:coproporphyrinogen III oxidase [Sulfurimonas aquatica]QSZ41515.1 coproporphyrinogen III oxidase [Sulfurimonas aquatica]
MNMIMSNSDDALGAYKLVRSLQNRFVTKLNKLSKDLGANKEFEEVTWLRDNGIHGGGSRFEARDEELFNTASVNVSQVHYDEMPEKSLKSATAISTIIHPKNPHVPSIHIHISLTQLRDGSAYWRLMADLNPSIYNQHDKNIFDAELSRLSLETFEEAAPQGDKYFYIPALKRHRGVSHFYLENYKSDSKQNDYNFAEQFGEGVIDIYIDIITNALKSRKSISNEDMQKQRDYHTLYLFQVLTLDRGTTSGLLIHNQNDVGIMGSLPSHVNKELLQSWASKVETPQDKLVKALADAIDEDGSVDVRTKEKLAEIVRVHYRKYPQALSMQASGNTIPDTVNNHIKS